MIITIADHKGGVGKTTTAAAISQGIPYVKKKAKSVLIDMDWQGSATKNVYDAAERSSIYEVIKGKVDIRSTVEKTEAGYIIPSSEDLSGLDVELSQQAGRDFILKSVIEPLKEDFSHIIIDTAPGRGTCLIQALTASDAVLIPLQVNPQALEGLKKIVETITDVQKYCNTDLKILGVVLTQYNGRATLTKQYEGLIEKVCKLSGIRLLKSRIRNGIAIQEAQALKENLFEYAPKSKPAEDYLSLIKELKL